MQISNYLATYTLLFLFTDYNECLKSFLNECVLMKRLDHPNILPIIGVCLESNHVSGLPFMVLPFMVNGDLKSYLKNKRSGARCVDQYPEVCTRLIIYVCKLNIKLSWV